MKDFYKRSSIFGPIKTDQFSVWLEKIMIYACTLLSKNLQLNPRYCAFQEMKLAASIILALEKSVPSRFVFFSQRRDRQIERGIRLVSFAIFRYRATTFTKRCLSIKKFTRISLNYLWIYFNRLIPLVHRFLLFSIFVFFNGFDVSRSSSCSEKSERVSIVTNDP